MPKKHFILSLLAVAICAFSLIFSDLPQAAENSPSASSQKPESKPREGEICISGKVVSIEEGGKFLQFQVVSFSLFNGKTSVLRAPKNKLVSLDGQTVIESINAESPKLSVSDLKPGTSANVIGPDSGTGKALVARRIEVLPGDAQIAPSETNSTPTPLQKARAGFQTRLISKPRKDFPIDAPPEKIFKLVSYPVLDGQLPAYLSPNPGDGKKHPAIIWITGGDCNSIGDVWSPAPRSNDQTAAAFRNAGIVMMFPSLRGGNNNPGFKEGFLGEVDDILDAARFLEKQDYVDPRRIYLGGHSTGGTMALLVAECSQRFRGVFSFGPVADVAGYGEDSDFLPFDVSDRKEVKLRSPGFWLHSIQTPTWVFEGSTGNTDSLKTMAALSMNHKAHFIEIKGGNHFNILAPTNELIAQKILQDTGEKTNISFSAEEVIRNFAK